MKKITFLLTILIYGFSCVIAQTTIPAGNVSGTWNFAGSPYLIQGSIMIPNGETLTIEPGVTVNFQGAYKLYVQGSLMSIGTLSDTIVFTCVNTIVGWRGIRFDNVPTTNDTSKLSYCNIQYGKATGTSPDDEGGAFYFNNFSKVIISNCSISNCTADHYGGGIYCYNSSPTIANNSITNNSSSTHGGGIHCRSYSNPTISNNTISGNTSGYSGSGIYCNNSSPIISNNTIINNSSNNNGGGVYCYSSSSPDISNNTISDNSAIDDGGGIWSCSSSPTISNNTISNNSAGNNGGGIFSESYNSTISNNTIAYNTASNDGGGIYCFWNSSSTIAKNLISNNLAHNNGGEIFCYEISNPTISNNIISNNSAYVYGGGMYCEYDSSPTITNNTITNNRSVKGGGLFCTDNSDPMFHNTILWGNTATTGGLQIYLDDESSDPNFNYCDVQGNSAAFGLNGVFYTGNYEDNIDADPLFVAPSTGSGTGYDGVNADWSLQAGSSCIDAGTPDTTGLNLPATDLAGNPRVINGCIDIGAYESLIVFIPEETIHFPINIYPNPANDVFIIDGLQVGKIEIMNIQGQVIKNVYVTDTKINIDISKLSGGVYFIKIRTTDGIIVKKMIKQ